MLSGLFTASLNNIQTCQVVFILLLQDDIDSNVNEKEHLQIMMMIETKRFDEF